MNAEVQGSRPLRIFLWGVLAAALALIAILFARAQKTRSSLPEYYAIAPFTLTNQFARAFTLSDLRGKVWIADIIFTRCAGPCPRMTEQMEKLQAAFPNESSLRFVTLTTDPEFDSPEVLKRYGEKFDADSERWFFLTGTKPEIKQLALGSLKLGAEEKPEEHQQNENDLFIHATTFVLVDKAGKVRGFYQSDEPDFHQKIATAVKSLLGERR